MSSKSPDQLKFWQEHIERFAASGLSRRAYCVKHGLKLHQLTYKLQKQALKPSAFARVVTPRVSTPPPKFSARLVFGGGVTLDVETGTDPVWLAQLVTSVGGRR